MSFQALVKGLTGVDGGVQGQIPSEWRQGRTAYGGVTTGLALEAALRTFPGLPVLRSLQMTFVGPVISDPVFRPTVLRKGRNVTTVRVDAFCEAQLVATVVFIFGASRDSVLKQSLHAPAAGDPAEYEMFAPPNMLNQFPAFISQFDMHLIEGARPMSGAKEGYIRTWCRHKDSMSREGIGSFVAIGDVLPPAAMPTFSTFGPVSSINWQLNILKEPTTRDGWWHIETKQSASQDGYSSQIMRFWNSEGDLVAEGTQSVALFI